MARKKASKTDIDIVVTGGTWERARKGMDPKVARELGKLQREYLEALDRGGVLKVTPEINGSQYSIVVKRPKLKWPR